MGVSRFVVPKLLVAILGSAPGLAQADGDVMEEQGARMHEAAAIAPLARVAGNELSEAVVERTTFRAVTVSEGDPPNDAPTAFPPRAEQPPLRLAVLVADVLARNPDLAALEERIVAAEARVPQAGALPDPMLMYGVMNEGGPVPFQTLGEAGFSEVYVGFSQDFLYPGKRALRERVAAEDVEVERWSLEAARRRVVSVVKQMYFEVAGLQIAADVLERNRRSLEQLERIAAVRLAVGKTSQQDVLDAEVELSRIEERLSTLWRRALLSEASLRNVLGQKPDWTLPRLELATAPPPLPPLEELRRAAAETAPEVRGEERQVARAEAALALAHRELRPDPGATFTYHNRGGLDPYWTLGGTIRIPLYAQRKQRRAIEESDAVFAASLHQLDARRLDAAFQVEDAYATASTALRLIALYDEAILKQARLAVDSARANYEVGKIDFLTTLTSWVRLRDYEVTYYERVVEYHQALARLEALTGRELIP